MILSLSVHQSSDPLQVGRTLGGYIGYKLLHFKKAAPPQEALGAMAAGLYLAPAGRGTRDTARVQSSGTHAGAPCTGVSSRRAIARDSRPAPAKRPKKSPHLAGSIVIV